MNMLKLKFTKKVKIIQLAEGVFKTMKWISIEDELPKINDHKTNPRSDDVLVYTTENKISIGSSWPYREELYFLPDNREIGDITHWMPLPEGPK